MSADENTEKNEELKKHIIDEISSLDADLEKYKESIEEYKNIPKGAEVGDEYRDTLALLEEVAEKLESLPKQLQDTDKS